MVGKTKKILVTGSKGMLGSSLCMALQEDFEVVGIDKDDCDITNKEKTLEFIKNLGIDVVVHCAAYTDVDRAEDEPEQVSLLNVEGTKNIIEA